MRLGGLSELPVLYSDSSEGSAPLCWTRDEVRGWSSEPTNHGGHVGHGAARKDLDEEQQSRVSLKGAECRHGEKGGPSSASTTEG